MAGCGIMSYNILLKRGISEVTSGLCSMMAHVASVNSYNNVVIIPVM